MPAQFPNSARVVGWERAARHLAETDGNEHQANYLSSLYSASFFPSFLLLQVTCSQKKRTVSPFFLFYQLYRRTSRCNFKIELKKRGVGKKI